MFSIIGIVLVIVAIVGGYLMEKGNLLVLLQPAELIIIAGAAAGTVLIANPLYILKQIMEGITGVFKGSRFTQTALSGFSKAAVRPVQPLATRGLNGHRGGYRRAG